MAASIERVTVAVFAFFIRVGNPIPATEGVAIGSALVGSGVRVEGTIVAGFVVRIEITISTDGYGT